MRELGQQESLDSKPKLATIDGDLKSAESYLRPLDEAEAICVVLEEVLDGMKFRSTEMKRLLPTTEATAQRYLLPDIPGQMGDIMSIRRYIAEPGETLSQGYVMYETQSHRLGTLEQGGMWVMPPDKKTYLRASLSECTVMAGKLPDGTMLAAHISYSELLGLVPAIDFFEKAGVKPRDIRVIASVRGGGQQHSGHNKRAETFEDYAELGITKEHFNSFEWSFRAGEHSSLTQVIVGPDFLYQYSFDLKNGEQSGYYDEKIMNLVD